MSKQTDKRIVVGTINSCHGVTGLVRVTSYTDPVERICSYSDLELTNSSRQHSTPIKLHLVQLKPTVLICRIAGVATRNQAEALRGSEITVCQSKLDPLAPGEIYMVSLLGRKLVTDQGKELGEIINVYNFGAGDILEIQLTPRQKNPIMLPFSSAIFTQVEVDAAEVVVAEEEFNAWTKPIL